MEDRRLCPHCGKPLYKTPYLMARDPDAEWPGWGKYGIYLLMFVIAVGVFTLAHA